ncbi:unannotated protein [freshwater metagenome]|uniref:Unannotated protein n=1 Tax=freshwater metagenome TaxID=449393 RepID=A0A6J6E811_9ZZZZ
MELPRVLTIEYPAVFLLLITIHIIHIIICAQPESRSNIRCSIVITVGILLLARPATKEEIAGCLGIIHHTAEILFHTRPPHIRQTIEISIRRLQIFCAIRHILETIRRLRRQTIHKDITLMYEIRSHYVIQSGDHSITRRLL